MIEPRKDYEVVMADGVKKPEGNKDWSNWETKKRHRGLRAWHVSKVIVGTGESSAGAHERVSVDKSNKRGD